MIAVHLVLQMNEKINREKKFQKLAKKISESQIFYI